MTFLEILSTAIGNTFRSRLRTALTVLAIFVGAFTLTLTDEAKEFIAGCSRRWADAWIAAGASEDAARGAEARTTAFYTGQES